MQKNELDLYPNTINKLKLDQIPKCKSWNYKTLKRTHRGKSSLPQKVQVTKLKINRLDFIKVGKPWCIKGHYQEDNTHNGKKNICKAHNW